MLSHIKKILIIIVVALVFTCCSCKRDITENTNQEYTVIYNLMGGVLDNGETGYSVNVKHGSTVDALSPIKDGYKLVGWTTKLTESFTPDFNFSTPITSNTVLYAVWHRPNLNLEVNGGMFSKYSSAQDLIKDFMADFSSFVGWNVEYVEWFFDVSYGRGIEMFKNSNYGTKWIPLLNYLMTTSNNPSYIKEFVEGNRDGNTTAATFVRAELHAFLQQEQITRTSWPRVTSGNYGDASVVEGVFSYFPAEGVNFYNNSSDYILPTPHKEGYYFAGWYDNPEFSGTPYTVIEKGTTDDLSFYAKWNKIVKLNYVYNVTTYNSKKDLYTSFFTDFYNFIIEQGGNEKLLENNITSVEEFLNVGLDYDYGNGRMRGLANIVSSYFLNIEIGGTLDSQPTDKFIGYCYQNNKYVEFIEFLITFFAWWREDEGYTTSTNNGSDFFASSWAALVDTQKFFYYDENTSYVDSIRVLNCFKYIPGVFNTSGLIENYFGESSLKVRELYAVGYEFVGYYPNSDYTGDIIEELLNCNESTYTVYVKLKKVE